MGVVKAWGLVTRRERWGLSFRGWLTLIILLAPAVGLCFWNAYSFLTITDRAPAAHIMVVEGWVPRFTIRAAAAEFATGRYSQIYTTGGPISGEGGYTNEFNTFASVGAGCLREVGVPADVVQMVPARVSGRDRTYASAVALRDWLHTQHRPIASFDVVTENTHARRSQFLFQKAFGGEAKVGVIAVENPDYAAGRWWESSEGFKSVISEGIAYIYAKLLFRPQNDGTASTGNWPP